MDNSITIAARHTHETSHTLDSIHPILRTVLLNRGVTSVRELSYSKQELLSYHKLKDIEKAANLLIHHIKNNNSIVIIGDYDTDGATSTALCIRFFRDIGYKNINYVVPNRVIDGYGLTPEIVDNAMQYTPKLIITVDNGISSIEGVSYAKSKSIQVLITDHHLPSSSLPDADAIVNPNQPRCDFPSKNLAGVGVAFYVISALRAKLRENGYFINKTEPLMSKYLDLVALGTVADVVTLDRNNRILVQSGIENIRQGYCSIGFKALCEIAKKKLNYFVSSDFGFSIAPRLNAAGRLEDMSIGIKCLLSDDLQNARKFAVDLERLNNMRKDIELSMHQDALSILNSMLLDLKNSPDGICLYSSDWHEGVIGILAGRLKEKYNRPAVVFAKTPTNGLIKGSARSIKGIHIKDMFESIAASNPGLMVKFGGHAMAAGLSIMEEKFTLFREEFIKYLEIALTEEHKKHILYTDGIVDDTLIDLDLAKKIYYDIPWGQGFPEPCFQGTFEVLDMQKLHDKHLKFTLQSNGRVLKAIAFNVPHELHINYIDQVIKIVYKMSINTYYEEETQFIIEHLSLAN